MPLVLRLVKGSPLSNAEVDGNFSYLDAKPADNVAGGTAGSIVYQSDTDTTSFVEIGASGYVLVSSGTGAPTWQRAASGATGGGTDMAFFENQQTVTADYTISSGKNAGSFGPMAIDDGVTVTVPSGSTWTIV